MHDTALITACLFANTYKKEDALVVDIGGKNVNGSVRPFFEQHGMKFVSLDIEEDASVDIVMKPGDPLPFSDNSVDIIVSTSCFEHDPCFWITFKEMCRICKMDGIIYINAPSNGQYHGHPGDNWRFYKDAAQALAYWASKDVAYPVKVLETFHVLPLNDQWIDFVAIYKRVDEKTEEFLVKDLGQGPLELMLRKGGVRIQK